MANLGKFGALRTKFAGLVDFVTIYIAEAHPAERKEFKDNYDIETHSNMEERIAAAEMLKEEAGEALEGCPILVRCDVVIVRAPRRAICIKYQVL